jgi:hypothetical protein
MSTSLDERLSECQPKTSSTASDDEDAIVQLYETLALVNAKSRCHNTYLELAEAVRCLRFSLGRKPLRNGGDAPSSCVVGQDR